MLTNLLTKPILIAVTAVALAASTGLVVQTLRLASAKSDLDELQGVVDGERLTAATNALRAAEDVRLTETTWRRKYDDLETAGRLRSQQTGAGADRARAGAGAIVAAGLDAGRGLRIPVAVSAAGGGAPADPATVAAECESAVTAARVRAVVLGEAVERSVALAGYADRLADSLTACLSADEVGR